ncbi:SDR family oxidoreductase (plasmid) [Rhizorhabdus wittichii DC-6]|nr:SDR family oxidoreductase [Rhizorhabdus wittichii DC-6]
MTSAVTEDQSPLDNSGRGRVRGKTVLFIGAGCFAPKEWGIGKATAVQFAREGANVLAVDASGDAAEATADVIRQEGGSVATCIGDVTKSGDIVRMVDTCIGTFGRIDTLFYNVGVGEPNGPPELSEESWDRTWNVNCKGLFLASKHALPLMLEQGSGNVIGVSSIAGLRYIGQPHFAYATTKAAMIQFNRYLALEYGHRGIRANTLVPGLIDTPRIGRLSAAFGLGELDAARRLRDSQTPTGKTGTPWEVAHAAVFLASDESSYVNGTELIVDGGLAAKYGPMAKDRQSPVDY